ncbi:MAG TPA: RraA family protein [Candidatus Limnocylindrales bacterium]|nr:RraA family protein [Candidatus Limnocylindrales bacterium]
MNEKQLAPAQLEQFRRLSTCVVASAIETFRVRLPNAGFTDGSVRSMFPDCAPVVGYAATARIRSADPPMEGHNYYFRAEWWDEVLKMPAPRIVVVQDLDTPPGRGAFVGEVHANILQALGSVALVTNGAVRDLTEVRATGFQLFAGSASVSHAYAHVFDFGGPVKVGGLEVRPGNLVQADRHGVQTIPLEIAAQVPAAAERILKRRQYFIGLCRSGEFSLQSLRGAMEEQGERDGR